MRVSTTGDLGALVRQKRQDQGLTQAELAERIGTTRQWVSQFESGTLNPRVGLVLAALTALDLDIDVRSSASTNQMPSIPPAATALDWMRSVVLPRPTQRLIEEQALRVRAIEARRAKPSTTSDPEQ